jgi:hypothetical protein
MSGDKLPLRRCPECNAENSAKAGAKLHCDSPESNCTWITCVCKCTYDIYTGDHFGEQKETT